MTTLNDLVKIHGLVGVTFISPRGARVSWRHGEFFYRDSDDGYFHEECFPEVEEEGWTVEEPEYTETRWVNIYNGTGMGHSLFLTKEQADRHESRLDRIACVKVEIKWKRRQFDE